MRARQRDIGAGISTNVAVSKLTPMPTLRAKAATKRATTKDTRMLLLMMAAMQSIIVTTLPFLL